MLPREETLVRYEIAAILQNLGFSYKEIAYRMGYSVWGITTLLHRKRRLNV